MSESTAKTDKLSVVHYFLALGSFIPLLGVPVGVGYAVYGYRRRAQGGKRLIALGFAGVGFTVMVYSYLFWQMRNPTGDFAQAEVQLIASHTLPDFVRRIEYFRIQHNHYPESLEDLGSEAMQSVRLQSMSAMGRVFYQRIRDGKHYHLGVAGPDRQPFTSDDILPKIGPEEAAKTGYQARP